MSRSINTPNLPKGKVNAVICTDSDKAVTDFFSSRGITVISNLPNPDIDPAVSFHADMAALHTGKNNIVLDKRQKELKEELIRIGFTVYETETEIKGSYPDDIRLNVAVMGDFVFGNISCTDKNALKLLSDKEQVTVKQGYTKCSVLVVGENAAITDDSSVHRKFTEKGIDCLLITKGDISLPGHGYGFIGGASGKISENEVVFFGDITRHGDFSLISAFLQKHGCTFLCTDNGPLRDIGGIIPVKEE